MAYSPANEGRHCSAKGAATTEPHGKVKLTLGAGLVGDLEGAVVLEHRHDLPGK